MSLSDNQIIGCDEFSKNPRYHICIYMKCHSFGTFLFTFECVCIFLEITLGCKAYTFITLQLILICIDNIYITRFYLVFSFVRSCTDSGALCVMSGMCTQITVTFLFLVEGR
jgi:hypothetical protein